MDVRKWMSMRCAPHYSSGHRLQRDLVTVWDEASQYKMPTIETGLGTVMITGSSGLIGSAFLAHVGERYRELCLDSKGPPGVPPKTAHMIPCNLTSDENLHQALDEVGRFGHR